MQLHPNQTQTPTPKFNSFPILVLDFWFMQIDPQ
jgi:hypothetical protein